MQEMNNILRILEGSKEAIERGDAVAIKNLSNQTVNTASLTQDPDNITVAVIVYSLSKILERENYRQLTGWKNFYSTFIAAIDGSIAGLKRNDDKVVEIHLEKIRVAIEKLSGKLKVYIKDVFRKARINKASRIYEHGISMGQTARLLGITQFELASYAGQTGISDVPLSQTLDAKSRVKLAMEMFS
ncbi:hypothetical protein ACFLZJ_01730 [Nanoarchaeota archaeon]